MNKNRIEMLAEIENKLKNAFESSIINRWPVEVKELLWDLVGDARMLKDNLENEQEELVNNRMFANTQRHNIYGGRRNHVRMEDEKRKDVYVVAYWMSKYEHNKIFPNSNQSQAFEKLAILMDVNIATLRQYRDAFDPHTGSHRKGYYQGVLNHAQEEILRIFEGKNQDNVVNEVKKILNKYEYQQGQ